MQVDRLTTEGADGNEWVVVDFRAGNDRNIFVQQISKLTNDSALRLAAQSQQNQVVPREDRIHKLRHNRFVVTYNARKKFFAPLEFANQVRAHLVFDRLPT